MDFKKLGIALAAVYAIYRFAPQAQVKAAALGVGGVIIARNLPFVRDVM
jgi:hypothetical protein